MRAIYKEKRSYTLPGCIERLYNGSKISSIIRNNRGRYEASHHDISLQDMKDLWDNQEGCCYYSGVTMNYTNNELRASLGVVCPTIRV